VRGALILAAFAVLVGVPGALAKPAQAPPRVCEGLTICSPVAGPWVVVPGPTGHGTGTAVWQLACPSGFVGGLDARVADPWIEVTFPGYMGSPVNPGITTRRTVVFNAVSVGPPGRDSSFIPFVGCIPGEGGPRTPTGVAAPAAPAQLGPGPISRQVRTLEIFGRSVRARLSCARGRRLISSAAVLGIYTALKPTQRQLHGVTVTRSVVGGRIFVDARRTTLPLRIPVQVQIHVLCTGSFAR
jgi:hypothetical protein